MAEIRWCGDSVRSAGQISDFAELKASWRHRKKKSEIYTKMKLLRLRIFAC
jgi:hypothetical protein